MIRTKCWIMRSSSENLQHRITVEVKGMKMYLAVFAVLASLSARAADLHGKVVSVTGAEPLRQVEVTVLELKRSVVTGDNGTFTILSVPPGEYTLRISAVGFRLVTTPFQVINQNDNKEFSVALAPDNFRRVDQVEVKGDIFQVENPAIPGQMVLNPSELKEASTVLANDPFRAIQAMPGVSASQNNDFLAEFSLLGAPFASIGIYFDDVLVRSPFHTLPGILDGASVSALSSESVKEINLMPVAYPVEFGDGTGGAVQLRTREGSRSKPLFTVSVGSVETEATAEGELGREKKGAWLLDGRKSYAGYLVNAYGVKPTSDIELEDGSVKLDYDLTSRHNLNFYGLSGHTDVAKIGGITGLNSTGKGSNQIDLVRAGWNFAVSPRLLLETHGAYLDESFDERNAAGLPLNGEHYGEWIAGTRSTWNWLNGHVLETGYVARRLREGSSHFTFNDATGVADFSSIFAGTGLRQTAYAQNVSSFFHQRLHVMAGLRWDHLEQVDANPVSPQVSFGLQVAAHTQVQFGFGRYMQFPDFSQIAECPALFRLLPLTELPFVMESYSSHFTAAIEQRLGENTRVLIQGFDRQDSNRIGSAAFNGSSCSELTYNPALQSSLGPQVPTTRARGAEIILQRRSANRFSGWIGYTYDDARQTFRPGPALSVISGPAIGDQRHTLNMFGNYRLSSSVNLSAKFLYGSGFPFLTSTEGLLNGKPVVAGLFATTIPAYQRLDLRVDKSWPFQHWKMTLHMEVLNVLNHNNPIVIGATEVGNRVVPEFSKALPVLPAAGLVFEF